MGFLRSTGGRPAYDITKGTIEQLREKGMNWRSIAVCLGVSEQTLYGRRILYGIENNFTDVTEEELDEQTKLILNFDTLQWRVVCERKPQRKRYKCAKMEDQRKLDNIRRHWKSCKNKVCNLRTDLQCLWSK